MTATARQLEYWTAYQEMGSQRKVAEKFGGGGHRNAAGCTLRGNWEEVENTIVTLLLDAVKRANGARDITEDALKETESVI